MRNASTLTANTNHPACAGALARSGRPADARPAGNAVPRSGRAAVSRTGRVPGSRPAAAAVPGSAAADV